MPVVGVYPKTFAALQTWLGVAGDADNYPAELGNALHKCRKSPWSFSIWLLLSYKDGIGNAKVCCLAKRPGLREVNCDTPEPLVQLPADRKRKYVVRFIALYGGPVIVVQAKARFDIKIQWQVIFQV